MPPTFRSSTNPDEFPTRAGAARGDQHRGGEHQAPQIDRKRALVLGHTAAPFSSTSALAAARRPAIPHDARGVEHRSVHARPRVVPAGSILARDRHRAGAAQAVPASHALLDGDLGRQLPRATERRHRSQHRRPSGRVHDLGSATIDRAGQGVDDRAALPQRAVVGHHGDKLGQALCLDRLEDRFQRRRPDHHVHAFATRDQFLRQEVEPRDRPPLAHQQAVRESLGIREGLAERPDHVEGFVGPQIRQPRGARTRRGVDHELQGARPAAATGRLMDREMPSQDEVAAGGHRDGDELTGSRALGEFRRDEGQRPIGPQRAGGQDLGADPFHASLPADAAAASNDRRACGGSRNASA